MNNHGYGYALYYPYIHLQDENWLKVAALYYDGLKRIVPERFRTEDSTIVRSLNEEFQFIEDLHPETEIDLDFIAGDFLDFLREEMASQTERTSLLAEIRRRLPVNSGFRLHEQKVALTLQDQLAEMGLAKRIDSDVRWLDFEPGTGALYISFLAERIAERRCLPIVTDSPIFQPLIRSFQSVKEVKPKKDKSYALASFVIKSAIPQDIQSVPLDKIIRFRKTHAEKRRSFYEAIDELADKVIETESPEALKDCLNHQKDRINDAVNNLKLSFRDVGLSCATGFIGLSLPTWAGSLSQMGATGLQLASAGIICLGATSLIKEGMSVMKSRHDSPWSYVLSLQRDLSADSFLRRLLQGTKIS